MNGECIFSGKVQGNRRGLIGNHFLLLTRKLQFGCLKVTFLGNIETVIRLSLGLRHGALTQVIPFWAYCPPFFFFLTIPIEQQLQFPVATQPFSFYPQSSEMMRAKRQENNTQNQIASNHLQPAWHCF